MLDFLKRAHNAIHEFTARFAGKRTAIVATVLGTIDFLQVTDLAPFIPTSPSWALPAWTAFHPLAFAYLRLLTAGKFEIK